MKVARRRLPEYTVHRSPRARRARLTINDHGEAVVVLPQRAPERAAAEIVGLHLDWIERHQQRLGDRRQSLAARPALGAGRTVALEGVAHSVEVQLAPDSRRRSTVDIDDARRVITINLAPTDTRPAVEVLEPWLRRLARRWIAERVSELAPEMGVVPSAVTIRDQRSRWGSASHRGTLSFSWRLVLCPPAVLDYVVVHELAHLSVRGHPAQFWSLVERHAADPAAARRWLRENHAEVRRALD